MAKRISKQQIATAFQHRNVGDIWPPVLTASEAMQLLRIGKTKFYQLRDSGLFDSCCCRRGGSVRYWRDGLVDAFFNENSNK